MPEPPADPLQLEEITEGGARLLVTPGNKPRGPGTHFGGVFYNPAMALARDISVLVADVWESCGGRELREGLDGLAGAGARGVRWLVESKLPHVQFNDLSPASIEAIERNLAGNAFEGEAVTSRRHLSALLWSGVWDVVDVDPFGSPAPFMDAASRAVRHGGLLGFAATDTAALAGASPLPCLRRYGAEPDHGPVMHEVALRILAGFAAREAAKHDVAVTPVLAHATDHFDRVYSRVLRGARRADAALEQIGFSWRCSACGSQGVAEEPPCGCDSCPGGRASLVIAGPLWIGPLQDAEVAGAARRRVEDHGLARPEPVRKLLMSLEAEAAGPPLFFDLHATASRLGIGAAGTEAAIEGIRSRGFVAVPTHVLPWAVKTDAPVGVVDEVLREITATG